MLQDKMIESGWEKMTRNSADSIFSILSESPITKLMDSCVDIGMGNGEWLLSFYEKYIKGFKTDYRLTGLDTFVETKVRSKFKDCEAKLYSNNLETEIELVYKNLCDKKEPYSLAICLEVGEHISEGRSTDLVNLLCCLSDIVLFSAAYPDQDGEGHINCQYPSYWAEKFSAADFHPFDIFRHRIWNHKADPQIQWWYIQNTILYVKKEVAASNFLYEYDERSIIAKGDFSYLDIIHPLFFQLKTNSPGIL